MIFQIDYKESTGLLGKGKMEYQKLRSLQKMQSLYRIKISMQCADFVGVV